ncbi:DegT/DnrJ/EryC1/StrS family aminotransferase [Acetobacter vaccinii]|uniref:DegT/DnrJ/EryC1/StrS family aminotransferase n=1 Tax=Acetobacter vaccinii TaxID=2592655 RepID=UPI001FED3787|nr:DegT/DnrJ/EryC1/StrS family aminotransferase [Acetobacter vaccinii]
MIQPATHPAPSHPTTLAPHRPAAIDIPVALPRLPTLEHIIPYLAQIDTNRWYTNHGPLCAALQEQLARFWGLEYEHVALTTSATSGITLALNAHEVQPGLRCLMPSWTFTASAGAVVAAHLRPHFVDVRADTWCPDPTEMETLAQAPDVGAMLVVVPFGTPIDLAVWDGVSQRTGKPVIIDAAAAFDTLRADGPMPVAHCTTVVSMHATKVFGLGEGGAVLSRDPVLAERVRTLARFGFAGTRAAQLPGINAKISEYTAAVGLAGLDYWPRTRANWQAATALYRQHLPATLLPPGGCGDHWVTSTLNILWPDSATQLADTLAGQGIGSVSWWGTGCHTQPAYATCTRQPLPVTERLGHSALALPFWQDIGTEQVLRICATLTQALDSMDLNTAG